VKVGGRSPPFPDAQTIRALAELLTETGLTEIEYAVGDRRIRVARGPVVQGALTIPAVVEASSALTPAGPTDSAGAVKAPMVGTAYLAPQPGAQPFVRIGDIVSEGQSLMIIEAMKVMNEIRAHRSGRVAQILVADAQPVEYGTLLMLIE
jgi:acetyl-CoA carboxylase biotin carboxyl carrier protein